MQVTHDASEYSLQAPLQGFGYSCLAGVPGPRAERYMGLLFETATPDSQRDNISISVSKIAFALVPRLDTNRQWWAVEQPRNRGVALKSDDQAVVPIERNEVAADPSDDSTALTSAATPPRRLGPLAADLLARLAAISASDSFVFGMQRGNMEGLAPTFVDCDAARWPNGSVAWAGCDSTSHGHRSDVKAASGSQAGLIAYDYDWAIETVNWQDLSNPSNVSRLVIPPRFDYATFMSAAHAEGALVAMDCPMRNPITLRNQCDTTGRPITALLPGGAGHSMWTAWLDGFAAVAAAEAARGDAIIFRLFHEVTRTHCYWWSQAGEVTPAEYHAAWNYTRWYLEEHRQVDNLLWVYAPWQPSRYPGKAFVEWTDGGFYPGDENVDIVSFDNYDVDATFTAGMLNDCRETVAFAAAHGKIPVAGEFGTLGGTQNTRMKHFFTEAFLSPVLEDPLCRRIAFALTWANGPMDYPPAVLLNASGRHPSNEHYVPVPGDVAYDDFVAFLASNATLLARDLNRGVGLKSDDPDQPHGRRPSEDAQELSKVALAAALVALALSAYHASLHQSGRTPQPGTAMGVDVRAFGAIGDGKADDTAAFARAIASVNQGGTVLVPRGTFMLDQLTFVSSKSLALRGTGAASMLKLRSAPSQDIQGVTSWLLLNGCEDCAVANLQMDLNNLEATAIGVQASSGINISGCRIHNSPGTIGDPRPALVLHSTSGAVIEGNQVFDVSTWFYFGMSTHEGQISDCVLSANVFRNAKATSAANCCRSQIIGNTFDTSLYCGIELGGLGRPMADWAICGNNFSGCKEPALQVSALEPGGQTGYGTITGNTFSNGTSRDSCGVYCFGDVCDVVIANNLIRDCAKGIVLTVGAAGGCRRFSVIGNHVCDTRSAAGPCRLSVGIELGTFTSGGGKVSGAALADINIDGNSIDNCLDSGISLSAGSGGATMARCRIAENRMSRCANTGVSIGTHPVQWTSMTLARNECSAPIRLSIPAGEVGEWSIDANHSTRSPDAPLYLLAGSGGAPRISGLLCSGSPEGKLVAAAGSTCINTEGGKMATLWVKESGSTDVGWVAVA